MSISASMMVASCMVEFRVEKQGLLSISRIIDAGRQLARGDAVNEAECMSCRTHSLPLMAPYANANEVQRGTFLHASTSHLLPVSLVPA